MAKPWIAVSTMNPVLRLARSQTIQAPFRDSSSTGATYLGYEVE